MLSYFTTSFAVFLRPVKPVRDVASRVRTSPRRTTTTARQIQLFAGLIAVGVGVGLILQAGLGSAAWDVLNLALMRRFGAPIGLIALIVGFAAGALAVAFGARASWRSLIPVLVASPLLDVTVRLVPTPATLSGQVSLLFFGMIVLALGVGAYIQSGNGAGPSDLLFLQLTKTRLPVWAARVVLDGSVLLLGFTLGGPVGVGTLIVTAGMGPLVAISITWFDLSAAYAKNDARQLVAA